MQCCEAVPTHLTAGSPEPRYEWVRNTTKMREFSRRGKDFLGKTTHVSWS